MRGANLSGYQQNIAIGYKPCPNCGAPMKTDAVVCPRCGKGGIVKERQEKSIIPIILAIVAIGVVVLLLLMLSCL